MVKAKTVSIKVTPRAVELLRQIAEKTGEKQYRIVERLAEAEFKPKVKRSRQ